jgi:hypothetical protein
MANLVVLDAGNAIIKAKSASKEIKFTHAIKPLSEMDWERDTRGGNAINEDYVRVNGAPYLIGTTAERKTLKKSTFRTGASRYTKDYYGVFMATALSRLYSKSMKNLFLFASHAPGDYVFRENLMRSAIGDWCVEVGGQALAFSVDEVDCFDEPNGGASNLLYTEDGTRVQNPAMKRGTTLVIDIGGHTTDFIVVHPGGYIDNEESISLPGVGINAILDTLRDQLKHRYPNMFQQQNVFDRARLREALRTGEYDAGGYGMLDCLDLADEASASMLNEIANQYQQYGGTSQFNYVALTGGGGGTQESRLRATLNHPCVVLADDASSIEFANVRGGAKLFKVFEAQGLL